MEDDVTWENGDAGTNSEISCENGSDESFSKDTDGGDIVRKGQMRPTFKLIPDFIIPHLERQTYGRHLIWEDKTKGSFKVSRIHQSSELWSDECIAVYKV
ncbi:IRF tryptophan pentad repeat domain-containing protein [Trichonephila clavipes]|uniref:IRF tryptophan pentad repeat domain-containing protein n=1 Tax=Trichonephila clavipes TaxID=2585209 RepID=A0A8X6S9J4_TRICX|nr:IRF tryptophan pentad repeat domain-containing protein [Trichonephila clavipes]